LAKTKDQQKSLPDLVGLKRGAVPYKATKPDARKTIGNSERLYDQQSREAFDRSWRFLQRVHDAATSQGVNDLSITALRAYISLFNSEQRSGAGRIEHIPTLGAVFSIVLIRRTLCLTEPSERDLALLQKDCQELTNYLMNADCIRLERALAQGTLDELRDMKSDDPDNTLESWAEDYRLRTPWSSLNGWLREKRLLLPSKERVYRKEYLKHLRFDRQLLELVQMPMDKWYSEWRNICDREVDSSDGRSFAIYIMPRWEKIMSDLFDIQTELCCIEAGIASERYRIKHGVWPKGWDDIVPSLLEKRPVDVKTQQPLLMKRLPNGLVVYGLGHDDTDNGGDVLQAMTPDGSVSFEPDGRVERHFPQDIGFRLFDPAARRQPAPPKPKKTPSPE
jgi:hypothetical protein